VSWEEDVSVHERQMLGDPQTSGGLLFAVAPEKASALVAAMEKVGTSAAAIVGRVMAGRDIRVVRSSPS
jgi:selenide,water dikinase